MISVTIICTEATRRASRLANSIAARIWLTAYNLECSRREHAAAKRLLSEAGCCIALVLIRIVEGRND